MSKDSDAIKSILMQDLCMGDEDGFDNAVDAISDLLTMAKLKQLKEIIRVSRVTPDNGIRIQSQMNHTLDVYIPLEIHKLQSQLNHKDREE